MKHKNINLKDSSIDKIVHTYETENPEGFSEDELEDIRKEFDLSENKMFDVALDGLQDRFVVGHSDVILAIRSGLEYNERKLIG